MNETTLSPFPPPPQSPRKPVVGILSCVAAILSILSFCGLFVMVFVVGSQSGYDPTVMNYETLTNLGFGVLALGGLSVFFSLLGLVLGVIGVFLKTTTKVWAIVGLLVNGLIFLGYCAFFSLSIIAYSTIGTAPLP